MPIPEGANTATVQPTLGGKVSCVRHPEQAENTAQHSVSVALLASLQCQLVKLILALAGDLCSQARRLLYR